MCGDRFAYDRVADDDDERFNGHCALRWLLGVAVTLVVVGGMMVGGWLVYDQSDRHFSPDDVVVNASHTLATADLVLARLDDTNTHRFVRVADAVGAVDANASQLLEDGALVLVRDAVTGAHRFVAYSAVAEASTTIVSSSSSGNASLLLRQSTSDMAVLYFMNNESGSPQTEYTTGTHGTKEAWEVRDASGTARLVLAPLGNAIGRNVDAVAAYDLLVVNAAGTNASFALRNNAPETALWALEAGVLDIDVPTSYRWKVGAAAVATLTSALYSVSVDASFTGKFGVGLTPLFDFHVLSTNFRSVIDYDDPGYHDFSVRVNGQATQVHLLAYDDGVTQYTAVGSRSVAELRLVYNDLEKVSVGATQTTVKQDLEVTGHTVGVTAEFSGNVSVAHLETGDLVLTGHHSGTSAAFTGNVSLAHLVVGDIIVTGYLTVVDAEFGGAVDVAGNLSAAHLTAEDLVLTGHLSGASAAFTGNVSALYLYATEVVAVDHLGGSTADFSGNVSTAHLATGDAVLTGHLSGASAAFSGNVSVAHLETGDLVLTGHHSGTSAAFSGNVSLAHLAVGDVILTGHLSGASAEFGGAVDVAGNLSAAHFTAGDAILTGHLSGASAGFTGVVDVAGNLSAAHLATGDAVLTGHLSGASAEFSGNVSVAHLETGDLVLTGHHSGTSAAFTGNVSLAHLAVGDIIVTGYLTAVDAEFGGVVDVAGNLSAAHLAAGDAVLTGLLSGVDAELSNDLEVANQLKVGGYASAAVPLGIQAISGLNSILRLQGTVTATSGRVFHANTEVQVSADSPFNYMMTTSGGFGADLGFTISTAAFWHMRFGASTSNAGTITDLVGVWVESTGVTGTGSVTTAYGIKVDTMGVGTTRYGIYVATDDTNINTLTVRGALAGTSAAFSSNVSAAHFTAGDVILTGHLSGASAEFTGAVDVGGQLMVDGDTRLGGDLIMRDGAAADKTVLTYSTTKLTSGENWHLTNRLSVGSSGGSEKVYVESSDAGTNMLKVANLNGALAATLLEMSAFTAVSGTGYNFFTASNADGEQARLDGNGLLEVKAINVGGLTTDTDTNSMTHGTAGTSVLELDATHATYTGAVLNVDTTRAANSAFDLLKLSSASDPVFRVDGNGDYWTNGALQSGDADIAEMFENDGAGEIPYGTTVVLTDEGKVRPSNGLLDLASKVIGVVRPRSAVGYVGNNPLTWPGRYQTTMFGERWKANYTVYAFDFVNATGARCSGTWYEGLYAPECSRNLTALQTSEGVSTSVEERDAVDPDFDPETVYIPRTRRRSEWSVVGLLGQIPVLDDQLKDTRWRLMKSLNDDVSLYLVR